ncbi:16S rRNA (cytosine(967)-C(5))-methyltransferase RsmB [Colwellia sp. 1_MG-2023]|uniref:16S rRNA (cytosine(967)-C(5))-methyltransferase RsmB n=1 Tax=unclassified Colwellia TaxID=196834 RepID=UPI001C08F55E|nr:MULTISPECIES: 16S rRNA (cytosine(967)-C(5))-methyltransferase RsmB [unclassified Colwellia]MBU2923498.1 16S rRNA (cytosine(967)-C(5))-methyltransferase RsmB [Colwellia sp. C2M11]MDO6653328.1 16S rRNA (cytosine(967)-C(5))-methyltransferase RsmB [Colwellia sp. 3_MG-2023]MDO6664427.1 16S rRNA (cytosine(967)-C(5))-methyltransferase RsmB [Colwellia sp. 2_MG-2023]MDO6688778.1 16S rRNA (cytosine(967)-C(5))-methyltransferase RsmB [Colwellia sp. 1_MG-2023]
MTTTAPKQQNQKPVNIRALAAKCCYSVIDQGRSLGDELPKQQDKALAKDKGLLQEICYGVMRYLPELENDVRGLMQKPLTGKQRVFHFLLLVGVYQIKYMRIPDHAAVSETVAATGTLKNRHMKALVNAVLRNFVRATEKSTATESTIPDSTLPISIQYNHPSWFIKKVQKAYPDKWQQILTSNQQKPPMWLRANQRCHDSASYQKLLAEEEISINSVEPLSQGIELTHPIDVLKLPGFEQGWISVQDGAAQQAARLLDCKPGDVVLDSCAAPGGKTCHILEQYPEIASMTAIDIEASRLVRVQENLARLNLEATVIAADAADAKTWWQGQYFDRILLDVPCSATGVIRRHPDIKWLRKASDIDALVILQQQILKETWSLLKPGGTLLYATCSILPQENNEQIEHFIKNNTDAKLIPIDCEQNQAKGTIGWQLLPGENNMDGFYYAKLLKVEA